ncbi:Nacetyltransferase [Acanthamoeba castellanii str. Neff]|uniref:Glucosamine 6-phosphate N-acetyltransferase n=1 Tax=Acanthamoeba castellanii (strain ATCC 30010 / Neff) TaxID=1257118 RepID=L8GRH7_ACACF|nr:Nacetyltransferase [Acanthamoeba castellanii str. Neff]ELR15248.1 Nacetyltransferase [Acanthamoeba castellanii str. Neff]
MSAVFRPVQDGDFVFRLLELSDYEKGICRVLGQLTEVGNVTKEQFARRFNEFRQQGDTYFVVVCEDLAKRQVAGCATLMVEKKIIHDCGSCGHIEDVVVDSTYRGKNLGLKLIQHLRDIGERLGCYKIILDCSEKNVPFYERTGFTKKEVQMVCYIPQKKAAL